MKRLLIVIALILLPFKVALRAEIKFENAVGGSLDSTAINTIDLSWDDLTVDVEGSYLLRDSTVWNAVYYDPPKKPKKPDTTREFLSGIDTVIVLHRIECDTTWSKAFVEKDTTFHYIDRVKCDTVFRVEYREVWEPMLPLYLRPEQLRFLKGWLSGRLNPHYDTLLPGHISPGAIKDD